MNYIKEIYAQIRNPRVMAILALAVIVLALAMVDAFADNNHHNDSHSDQRSVTH